MMFVYSSCVVDMPLRLMLVFYHNKVIKHTKGWKIGKRFFALKFKSRKIKLIKRKQRASEMGRKCRFYYFWKGIKKK